MFLSASNFKTLTVTAASCLTVLVLFSGLGCGSKSEPVSILENPKPPAKLAPADQADVSKSSSPPVVALQKIAIQDESPNQEEQEKKPAADSKKYDDKYTDQQLNKNLTILMLAYQPDVRARQLLRFPREQLTEDQEDDGLRLLLRSDHLFQRLIQRRQDVLDAASDDDETAAELRQIRIETIELTGRLRSLVFLKILTKEQRQARRKANQERILAEKVEAEKRKLKR